MTSNPKQLSSLSINTSRPPTSRPLSPTPQSPRSPVDSRNVTLRQRYCLPDPIAFAYLSEDPVTTVIDSKHELSGYQSYVVEQWACSRTHPTMVITAFTGDTAHNISVGILSVPANEEEWSPRLRVYFRSLTQYHARSKETPLGKIMVTNLSGFPSSLNIIPVPSGELKKHRELFFVNEDLKRLGCSGRTGLTLTEPNPSTTAKFYQLFKISTKVQIHAAVIELVFLCQVALIMFDCLGAEYADGLLCDQTEKAVNEWWTRIGTEVYNVDPIDGTLGPTTVAALLGLLLGARNRLSAFGAPISKDVFDIDATKRAIAYFQKTQGMPRTRRLDRYTLHQLHRATAKQASGEGWKMPRAVKSTVADLSGKGGEMVMEMVGRDKTKIADVETVDIEIFVQEVKGNHAQWLWQGKPKKRTTRDMFSEELAAQRNSTEASNDVQNVEDGKALRHQRTNTFESSQYAGDEEDSGIGRPKRGTVLDRAKGRLKDAVGLRPVSYVSTLSSQDARKMSKESLYSAQSPTMPKSSERSSGTGLDQMAPEVPQILTTTSSKQDSSKDLSRMSTQTQSDADYLKLPATTTQRSSRKLAEPITFSDSEISPANTADPSVVGDDYEDEDYQAITDLDDENFQDGRPSWQRPSALLQRTHSFSQFENQTQPFRNDEWWPRHLSFSAAEDSLNDFRSSFAVKQDDRHLFGHPRQELLRELLLAEEARDLNSQLTWMFTRVAPAVHRKARVVEEIDEIVAQDVDQLNALYHPRKEEYSALDVGSKEIISGERIRLREAIEDVETLGAKLDYEVHGLRSKVEDVEEAVKEYARQVAYTESRVNELVYDDSAHGWWGWIVSQFVDTRNKIKMPAPDAQVNGNGSASAALKTQ